MASPEPLGFWRSWDGVGSLREEWNAVAADWIAWARSANDSYWRFHRDRFLELLPPPPQNVVDVGAGEGRLSRDLKTRGYSVVAVDTCAPMVEAARQSDPQGRYDIADAAATDLPYSSFDGVIAFMCLHDVDDMPGVIAEVRRILRAGGWLAIAVVHPLNSAGVFRTRESDAPFSIDGSYLQERKYADEGVNKDGLHMRFASSHRPVGAYADALERSGFVIDRIREVTVEPGREGPLRDDQKRWLRVPLFLHLRAVAASDPNGA